jgi:hypothetical protein
MSRQWELWAFRAAADRRHSGDGPRLVGTRRSSSFSDILIAFRILQKCMCG